jgi:hypothetical protein
MTLTTTTSAPASTDWDFLDLAVGDEATVDRPTDGHDWGIPSTVALEDGSLVFRYVVGRRKSSNLYVSKRYLKRAKAKSDGRLLSRFIELADASDDNILAYARQYGRLGLCQHGELQHLVSDYPDCIQRGRAGKFEEPTDRWRENAKRARTLLNGIAQFSKSGRVSGQTLIAMSTQLGLSATILKRKSNAGRLLILAETSMWLRGFRVQPVILYDRRVKRFRYRLQGRPGLGAALAIQIMVLAGQSKGIAFCSSCARLYSPKRRPNASYGSYCATCGIKASWSDAQRRRRQRAKSRANAGGTRS